MVGASVGGRGGGGGGSSKGRKPPCFGAVGEIVPCRTLLLTAFVTSTRFRSRCKVV